MAITRAIVFDLGNVLIDIDFMRCVDYWRRRAAVPAAQIMARFRTDRHYEAFERGHLPAEAYFGILRRQLGLDLAGEDMTAGWNRIIRGEKPGVRKWLLKLKVYYPLYVLTNTNEVHAVEWGARHQDLLQHFNGLFVSSRMGCRKPDAEAYQQVIEGIDVPAAQIVFLDDTLENVEGALAVGMRAVHVRGPHDVAQMSTALLAVPPRQL